MSLSVTRCELIRVLPVLPQVSKHWVKCLCCKFPLSGSDPACSRGEQVPSRLGTIRQRKSPCFLNALLVCYLLEIQLLFQSVSVLIFSLLWSSQIHWVKIRLAYFDPGSHSCNLLMPPRSCGMALADHLTGWEAVLKPPLSDMSTPF